MLAQPGAGGGSELFQLTEEGAQSLGPATPNDGAAETLSAHRDHPEV